MRKYARLLHDKNLHRWHDNVGRGSKITAGNYLRKLGNFCEKNTVTPKELLKLPKRKMYNLLLDTVTGMEKKGFAGSYIASVLKAVKSWLAFNAVEIAGRIKVKAAADTPTLREERVPTKDELKSILLAADEKTRLACALVAFSGLRLQTLGSHDGLDGLTVRDFPDMDIKGQQVEFRNVPTMVKIRPSVSKARHEYFTFLGSEGCEYLKAYLEMRLRRDETLSQESAVIVPKNAAKEFITTTNIGDSMRKAIRKAGFAWRPYVLRSYFDTQMMLAESKGILIRDYRTFFMGHKGDIEAVYTLNKRRLPPEVVEQMRESYAKAQRYLETGEGEARDDDLRKEFKRQLLLVAGFKDEDIGDEQLETGEEEFHKLVRGKLLGDVKTPGPKQKVVDVSHVENYLVEGWEFVGSLPNRKAIVKVRETA